MATSHQLSLRSAVLININIMLGSGIFINSTILAKKAEIFGAFCYLLVGILMLPLIVSIAQLVSLYPSGGFYTFSASALHPFIGFLSTWSYITGKLASAVIVTQIAVLLMQQVFPFLAMIHPLVFNGCIMILFVCLNMLDIKTSTTIQTSFLGLKIIPVAFGILTGFYLFCDSCLPEQHVYFSDISIALPLVLFAIAGFEAACSLSSRIENATVNAPRAIFISYGIVILITTLFQLFIYGALGNQLTIMPDYRLLFPTLISKLLPSQTIIANHLAKLLHCAIAASALGGSYGIIFSNNWNVYTLAQNNHLFGSRILTQVNRYQIPWLCVLVEGIIYLLFLIISQGNQISLQQMGALGPTIAYTCSAFSLWYTTRKSSYKKNHFIALLAIGSCLLLFGSAIYGLLLYGPLSLTTFIILLSMGTFMFWKTSG